jgi:hypothetical protein
VNGLCCIALGLTSGGCTNGPSPCLCNNCCSGCSVGGQCRAGSFCPTGTLACN